MTHQLTLFDTILGASEGTDVEFKDARGGLPGSLWPTYSAFANTDGGTVWLGISERAGSLDAHGLDGTEKLISDFWNAVNNKQKISRNLLGNECVRVIDLPQTARKVIAIDVPRAGRRERPVHVGYDPFKGSYRRNADGDYLCTEDEVRRMFADQSDEPADSLILKGFTRDDLDGDSIRQFRNLFGSRHPTHPWTLEDDRGLLERLGGWRRDRTRNEEGVTVAGLLMFGTTEAVTSPEAAPGFHLDYRERFSEDPAVRWSDRVTNDGTWAGNLFQFYRRVILKLGSGPGIKQPFQLDAEGYRKGSTSVHEALQESLVNALIHADYRGQGGIVIDRYSDRLEFSNPGTLLVSHEQLVSGAVSECRNKALQRMFQMMGVGDKAGSGIAKIRSSWAANHWQSPGWKETQRPDRVKLTLPLVSMLPDDVLSELKLRFGDKFDQLQGDAMHTAVIAATEGAVSNSRLQEVLSLHRVDITKLLQRMVRDCFLLPDGVGRGTRYMLAGPHPTSIFVAGISPFIDGCMGERKESLVPPDSSAAEETIPLAKDPSSLAKDPSSLAKDPSSLAKDPSSLAAAAISEHPAEDDQMLLGLSRPIRESARSTPAKVRETILALCETRFLSLRELSVLLGRKPESLRHSYLAPLARSGELDLRYPGIANHPAQAYRRRQSR